MLVHVAKCDAFSFRGLLDSVVVRRDFRDESVVVFALGELHAVMMWYPGDCVRPVECLDAVHRIAPELGRREQNDASEFLQVITQRCIMHCGICPAGKPCAVEAHAITAFSGFMGEEMIRMTCTVCGRTSAMILPFGAQLLLNLPGDGAVGGRVVSVQSLLENNFAPVSRDYRCSEGEDKRIGSNPRCPHSNMVRLRICPPFHLFMCAIHFVCRSGHVAARAFLCLLSNCECCLMM
jgi:uncharacterized protein YuzB (UPF0349 family)